MEPRDGGSRQNFENLRKLRLWRSISWLVLVGVNANQRHSLVEWDGEWILAAKRLNGKTEKVKNWGRGWFPRQKCKRPWHGRCGFIGVAATIGCQESRNS